jgi:hypothetical protein
LKKEKKEEEKDVMTRRLVEANYLEREEEIVPIKTWMYQVVMMIRRLIWMLEDLRERVLER